MKLLLTISALFEGAIGLVLLSMPSTILPILIGISFSEPGSLVVTGITGAALISLAIACWLYRNSGAYAALLVKAMLFYNIASGLVLGYAGIGLHLSGIGLWPAAIIHGGMAIWCITSLKAR